MKFSLICHYQDNLFVFGGQANTAEAMLNHLIENRFQAVAVGAFADLLQEVGRDGEADQIRRWYLPLCR